MSGVSDIPSINQVSYAFRWKVKYSQRKEIRVIQTCGLSQTGHFRTWCPTEIPRAGAKKCLGVSDVYL